MEIKCFVEKSLHFEKILLKNVNSILEAGPKDLITCKKNPKGYIDYYSYLPGERKQHYISVHNKEYIEKLTDMGRMRLYAKLLKNNLLLQEEFLNKYEEYEMEEALKIIDKYTVYPEQLIANCPIHQSEKREYRDKRNHITSFGLMVRSKSEAAIAEVIYASGLKFFYEKAIMLKFADGTVKAYYPDFTIYLPNGKIIYWEHKGKMGDKNYAESDYDRMNTYFLNGIYEPENLIITKDGSNGELNLQHIKQIIDGFIIPIGKMPA